MSITFIDTLVIPIIVAGCLCIGFVMKKWMPTDDKWIPTILAILGAVSGIIVCGFNYTGVVSGMVSGLASVGLHQAFKQHLKLGMGDDELYAMGDDSEYDEELDWDEYTEDDTEDEEGEEDE